LAKVNHRLWEGFHFQLPECCSAWSAGTGIRPHRALARPFLQLVTLVQQTGKPLLMKISIALNLYIASLQL
jgi:hypothetical protein